MPRLTAFLAASFIAAVAAQGPGGGPGGGPAAGPASCSPALQNQILACRSQVYTDETDLPGGSCAANTGADYWTCYCNVQQGLLACYNPCPDLAPQSEIDANSETCAGQNGATNAAAVSGGPQYVGSPVTTTGVVGSLASTSLSSAASTSISSVATTSSTSTTPSTSSTSSSRTSTSSTPSTSAPTSSASSSSSSRASSSSQPAQNNSPNQSLAPNVFDGGAKSSMSSSAGATILAACGALAIFAAL